MPNQPDAYIHNHWYVAALSTEVNRTPLRRTLLDQGIVFFRTEAGEPVALLDRCPHRKLPLSMGTLQGDHIACGYHGLQFNKEGECVHIPGQKTIPPTACVRSFPVMDHLGMVWIWCGDPALADPGKAFQIAEYDDPAWGLNRGARIFIEADYRLIIDNLVDPSHVSFVHPTTLGTDSGVGIPVDTKQTGDCVIVSRWTLDSPPAPIFQKFGDFEGHVDRWQYYYLHVPNVAVIDFGSQAAGTGAQEGNRHDHLMMYSCNFFTPETAATSHYFFFQLRNFAISDEAVSAAITEQFHIAFDEDRVVLEAIQKEEEACDRPHVKLAIDNASVRVRRMIQRRVTAEQAADPARMAAE